MNAGVIGCGLIGKKRIDALIKLKKVLNIDSISVFDPYLNSSELPYGVLGFTDYDNFKDSTKLDFVIISVPHNLALNYVIDAIDNNYKKILVEKPFGKSYEEAKIIFEKIKYGDQLFVGFNYRFYDGVALLLRDIMSSYFGELISINMSIGYGGKPEDKNGWKLQPDLAGTGSLLDPGIHMINLLGLMFPHVTPVYGTSWSGFWNTGIMEDTHLIFKSDLGCTINLESSLTKWRNTFRIEVNGTIGYGIVDGRGGNYGEQVYITGKRWGWLNSSSQKDSERIIYKTNCETSFYDELKSLFGYENRYLIKPCNSNEAKKTMALYEECLKVIQ